MRVPGRASPITEPSAGPEWLITANSPAAVSCISQPVNEVLLVVPVSRMLYPVGSQNDTSLISAHLTDFA